MIRDIVKPTLTLAAVAFICTLLLSYVQKFTEPAIKRQKGENQDEALKLVLPGFSVGDAQKISMAGVEFLFWIGKKKVDYKTVKGYAFITAGAGYGGNIESMVGVDESGKILGVSILNQSETPGLGARCVEVANRETLWDYIKNGMPARDYNKERRIPWFQNQFEGIDANAEVRITRNAAAAPRNKRDIRAYRCDNNHRSGGAKHQAGYDHIEESPVNEIA